MGSQNTRISEAIAGIPANFREIAAQTHVPYGNLRLFQAIDAETQLALVKSVQNADFLGVSREKLRNYQENNDCEYLIKLFAHSVKENREFCGNSVEISLFLEFFPKNLQAELGIRRQNRDFFQETELFHVFLALLQANSRLKALDFFENREFSVENVLLSRAGLCKLLPKFEETGISAQSAYKSPELVEIVRKSQANVEKTQGNPRFPTDFWEKSHVFSLGMLLLEGLSLKTPGDFFDNADFRWNFAKIGETLENAQVSEGFRAILQEMLAESPEIRPSFEDLREKTRDFADNFLGIKLNCYSFEEFGEEIRQKPAVFEDLPDESVETRKKANTLLNLQEISQENAGSARDFARESQEIAGFRGVCDRIFAEALSLSEEVQRKYGKLTNRKEILLKNAENEGNSAIFLANSLVFKENSPRNSLTLKKVDSSTSISKDYHYFSRNLANSLTFSPFPRKNTAICAENLEEKQKNTKNIANFDFSPAKTRENVKEMGSSPKKTVKINHEHKKYFTPKRNSQEKMRVFSENKGKSAGFRERPATPAYEKSYWEALGRKFAGFA